MPMNAVQERSDRSSSGADCEAPAARIVAGGGPRRAQLRRHRDTAFALIGILALLAVLVLATISPPARAARPVGGHTHTGTAAGRR
jgi:hypothetical protein